MTTVTTKAMAKVAAVATGLAMATSMLALAPIAHAAALTSSQIDAVVNMITAFGADAATVANVRASLTGGTPSVPATPGTSSCSFSRSLTIGSTGADVTCLQSALIGGGFSIPAGATGYFGTQTRTAVASWQSSKNIAPAVGYFGPISRAAFNLGGTPGTPGTPAPTGNGLKVMLSADSPNNIALVQGQAIGDLAHFTFSNPTSADIKVTNLTFKRIGVSEDSALSNVYLFDGVMRITDPAGISNSTFNFNDSSGIITVVAGGTKTIQVRADIADSTSGQQIGVQLTALSSSGTLDSSVSLPISGYTQTVSSATIATVVFGTVSQPSGSSSLSPGNDITVFQSTLTIGTRAVLLRSITLENRGSTVDDDFQNLKLLIKGSQVGSTIAKTTNKKVVFDFSANPIRLETGGNELRVVADIVGGSGDTADFQVRRAVDGQFIDSNLNQQILPTGDLSGTADTIEGVDLSVTKASNSPSSTVAVDATNVKWGSFEFRAIGDDLKVEQITVDTDIVNASGDGLDNGKVFLNGIQIGSTQDIVEGGTTVFAFGSQMVLKKGTVAIVDIYSDAKTSTSTSMSSGATVDVGVSVATADTEGVKSGDRLTTAVSEVEGNSITVSSASLSASKVTSYSNQSVVRGTNNFKLGSFTLAAGANEGVNINTIDIDFASAVASTLTNLRLTNSSGTAIGSTKSSVGTSNTFSVSGVSLAASGSMVFDVYADVKSSGGAGALPATTVTTSTGGTGQTTGNSITVGTLATLQTMTVVASGTLTAAVNTGGTPADAIVVGGTNGVKIGSFSFLATNAAQTVNKLLVKVPSSSASAVSMITLKDGSTVLKSQGFDLGSPGTAPFATSTFTALGFAVPAGTSRSLDVYVDVVAIDANNAGLSGQSISVRLDGDEGFESTDGAGNLDTTLTGSTSDLNSDGTAIGVAVVRKAAPTLSTTPVTDTLAAGTDQVIGKFTITASNMGDNGIDWGKLAFTVTKTAAVTLGATTTVTLYDVTGGANTSIAGVYATTTGSRPAQTQMFTTAATTGLIDFRPTTVQNVPKGTSKSYELRTTVGGLAAGNNNLSISITNPVNAAVTTAIFSTAAGTQGTALSTSVPSFVWSDWSDVSDHFSSATGGDTADWTRDYLVKALPLTIGNRSASVSSS